MNEIALPEGSVVDCLADFGQRYPSLPARQLLTQFTRVTDATVDGWFRGKRPMGGLTTLRLACFLEAVGYQTDTWKKARADNRELGEMLGYSVISVEQAEAALGYSDDHGLMRITLHGSKVNPDREMRLEELLKQHRDGLERAKHDFKAQLAEVLQPASSAPASNGSAATEFPTPADVDLAEAFVHAVRTADALAAAVIRKSNAGEPVKQKVAETIDLAAVLKLTARLDGVYQAYSR